MPKAKPKADTGPTCAQCRYFKREDVEVGWCRRYPPVTVFDSEGSDPLVVFPLMDPGVDWCGEFGAAQ